MTPRTMTAATEVREALAELDNVPWDRLYGLEGIVDEDEFAGMLKTAWKAQRYVRQHLKSALSLLAPTPEPPDA